MNLEAEHTFTFWFVSLGTLHLNSTCHLASSLNSYNLFYQKSKFREYFTHLLGRIKRENKIKEYGHKVFQQLIM